jgi:hypothetical protein
MKTATLATAIQRDLLRTEPTKTSNVRECLQMDAAAQ